MEDVLGMFGDDPDSSVTIARFGLGTVFRRAREGGFVGLIEQERRERSGWSERRSTETKK